MGAMIQSMSSRAAEWIPAGINRDIAKVGLLQVLLRPVASVKQPLATLSAFKNTPNDTPFIQWLNKIYSKEFSKLRDSPHHSLAIINVYDLAQTVGAVASYFFLKDVSVHASLTTIFSQSEKVAKVALPVLNRISNLPIPSVLLSTRVILVAPIGIKLIHMGLSWLSLTTDGKYPETIELAKKITNELDHLLKMLLSVRYAIVCLSVSNPIKAAISFSAGFMKNPCQAYFSHLRHQNKIENWQQFFDTIDQLDIKFLSTPYKKPTPKECESREWAQAKKTGIQSVTTAFCNRYRPSEKIKIRVKNAPTIKEYFNFVRLVEQAIATALNEYQIEPFQAAALKEALQSKQYEMLKKIVKSKSFTDLLNRGCTETLSILEELYTPEPDSFWTSSTFQWGKFKNLLTYATAPVNVLSQKKEEIIKILQSDAITEQQKTFFNDLLVEKLEQHFTQDLAPHLAASNFFTKKRETKLRQLYGKKGLLVALSAEEKHLKISSQLLSAISSQNITWYLSNQHSMTEEQQQNCELALSQQLACDVPQIENLLFDERFKFSTYLLPNRLGSLLEKDFLNRMPDFNLPENDLKEKILCEVIQAKKIEQALLKDSSSTDILISHFNSILDPEFSFSTN